LTIDEMAKRGHQYLQAMDRRQAHRGREVSPRKWIDQLGSAEVELRRDAVEAVIVFNQDLPGGDVPVSVVVTALIQALQDPDPHVRQLGAEALGALDLNADPALFALVQALEDPEQRVRESAVAASPSLGPRGVAAVVGALRRRDSLVRRQAARALANATWLDPEHREVEVLESALK